MSQGPPTKLGKALVFEASGTTPGNGAVLWCHGFGDKPEGWASLLKPFRRADLPSSQWKWIHLRAPPIPQPCYGGRKLPGWGQFFSQECLHVGKTDHEDPDSAGFYAASAKAVHDEIEKLEKLGIPASKVAIGGFSQGAALALEVALTFRLPLAGCVALSGWLTPRARSAIEQWSSKSSPRFLICHGTKDDMVGFDCGEAAFKFLKKTSIDVKFEKFPGLEHSSCPKELAAVSSFLFSALSASGSVTPSIDWEGAESDSDGFDDDSDADTIYVPKEALQALKGKLISGEEVPESSLEVLQDLETLHDDAVLVPLPADVLGDYTALSEQLGPKGAGIILLKAAEKSLSDPSREMSLSDFRALQELQEGGEEEDMDNDEEEEPEEEDTAKKGMGPSAKRAKTS